ncbi:la-related protein 6-like [Thunnus maccoyii]|uniref:la-related protein 6-like n=1 Tax=Thunnus maccoyii TaxID=8240 RepID=UPI001C4B8B8F|nr:la-related protein 6-like [Thunnus maccoyii]XP_042285283.1 la-related protein 6-like [Thunnus maccoyii]
MKNQTGDDTQSIQDEEDGDGELLCVKIKTQLEDLFTDSHLAEDGFLLKHLQKNKQGYVSLKLLTCLKKIKVLTTNWHMTLAGAECSELLEVNDERTKVRRIEPLPKWLLCSPTSKFLLARNISEEQTQIPEHPSLSERILQKFTAHGSVTSVWILPPGTDLPKQLQCYAKRHKELGQHLCAVVKFDRLEAVRKAFNILKAEEEKSNGEGMCVETLGFQSMHHITKDEPTEEKNEDHPEEMPSQENCHFETSEELVQEKLSLPVKVSYETPDTSQPQKALNYSMQRPFDQITTGCNGQSFCGLNQRYSRMSWCSGDCDKESSQSPWVLRRKFAAGALKAKATGHLSVPCLLQRVLRQPFGPDDTKGFQGGRRTEKLLQQEEITLSPGWSNTTCSE